MNDVNSASDIQPSVGAIHPHDGQRSLARVAIVERIVPEEPRGIERPGISIRPRPRVAHSEHPLCVATEAMVWCVVHPVVDQAGYLRRLEIFLVFRDAEDVLAVAA